MSRSGGFQVGAAEHKLSKDMVASPKTMAHSGADAPDWDTHYGKAFKLVNTPEGAATNIKGKSIATKPGTLSLVTPFNGDSFHSWPEASDEAKSNFKNNWSNVWNQTGGYKQKQVLGSINGN
jgi:hypothetical protein